MAEIALKKVEKQLKEQLRCAICLSVYTNPKVLQCFHVFCESCLKDVVKGQNGPLLLNCPTCRNVTSIPAVTALPSAFHISGLFDIKNIITPSEKVPLYCPEHANKELELYCQTCENLTCLKCIIKGGKHQNHDCVEIEEAFKKYKEEVKSSLEPLEKQLKIVSDGMVQVNTCHTAISNQKSTIETEIHKTVRTLHEILDVRKTKIIEKLQSITEEKWKNLAVQNEYLGSIEGQLTSFLDTLQKSILAKNEEHVLEMRAAVMKQVKELTTPLELDSFKSTTEVDMMFLMAPEFITACENYGIATTEKSLDPSRCEVEVVGKGLEVAVVGETSAVTLQALNFNNGCCNEPIKSLQCELVSKINDTSVRCTVVRKQSRYEISFKPSIKGEHQLSIKAEGKHVKDSPLLVESRLPVERLGTLGVPILLINDIKCSLGVSINKREEIVFTSQREENGILIFSSVGEKLRSFGTPGSEEGQFRNPVGVAVDDEGNILVADSGNHRIQKFTASGQFLEVVGTKGEGPLQFNSPFGLSFNASNNKIYVTEYNNHRVQVLKSDLSFSAIFGRKGEASREFSGPCDISCDSTGNVYVADTFNSRIQVFTSEGTSLRKFESQGQPTGLAIDGNDVVYVSNREGCINLFSCRGEFVASYGLRGEGPGQFKTPNGLAVSRLGIIYVCDTGNNRIQLV